MTISPQSTTSPFEFPFPQLINPNHQSRKTIPMKTCNRINIPLFYLGISAMIGCPSALAATISWLDYSADPSITSGSVYSIPGGGTVTVTHNFPATHFQNTTSPSTGGIVGYNWSDWEFIGLHNPVPSATLDAWSLTFTFSNPQSAGSLYFGAIGLGSTTNNNALGDFSNFHVLAEGTYLGEYIIDPSGGATNFSSSPGSFDMRNSVTGAGGVNPHWNTNLGVVAINQTISFLTIDGTQVHGDGIGLNIGFTAVPEPSAALLGVASVGLLLVRRQRSRD
jgi:hypothetical protein